MIEGLPQIDATTLERMAIGDQRELLTLLDRADALNARDDLITYTKRVTPGYIASWVHREMAAKLEAVERGEIRRLMLILRPRVGKSLLASQRFVSWYLGRNPTKEVIATSYGGELVGDFGRRVRNVIESPEHREVFPESGVASDSRAADRWQTTKGGVYIAGGTTGPIAGRGADLFLIDDPQKSAADADSPVKRKALYEWWLHDAYSRLHPGSSVVFIGARYHHDDLAGRLLDEMANGGEPWDVVKFPAVFDDGTPLWPERFSPDEIERTRRAVGARVWSGLYMGEPTPDQGAIYLREWFKPSEETWTPRDGETGAIRFYAASDIAATKDDGDFTVHCIYGLDKKGLLHVVHLYRAQASAAEWIGKMIELAGLWKPLRWTFGSGLGFKMAEPAIRTAMRQSGNFVRLDTAPERGDKTSRSQSFAAWMENGLVRWNQGATWYAATENELLKFPAGRTDDIADTMSLIGLTVDTLSRGRDPAPPPPLEPLFTTAPGPVPEGFRRCTWAEVRDSHMKFRKRERRRSGATMEDLTTWPK